MSEHTTPHDRHDVHVAARFNFYAPVILWIGIPLLGVALFIFGVYVYFFWHQFIVSTQSLIAWVVSIIGLVTTILVISLIIKRIVYPLIEAIHKIGIARAEHARAMVLVEKDNYAVVQHPKTQELEFFQFTQERNSYSYKMGDTRVTEEVPEIEAPKQLSGRDLILNGTVDHALAQGRMVLGYARPSNELKGIKLGSTFSTIIGGIPSSGKTTTALWLGGQVVKGGGHVIVTDPHLNFVDEDGRKGLGQMLAPYTRAHVFPPCEGSQGELSVRVGFMLRELAKRQRPGYIQRASDRILWIMDEFNSIIDAIEDLEKFTAALALIEREGRKFGLDLMLIGHRFSANDIGKAKIRGNAANVLGHKMNDEAQAQVLVGSTNGRKLLTIPPGDYILQGILSESTAMQIHTPLLEAPDVPLLFGTSETTSDLRPDNVQSQPMGRGYDEPGKQQDVTFDSLPDHLREKAPRVLQFDQGGTASQNDVIRQVWGVEPQGRAGLAATEELRVIRKFIADWVASKL